MHAATVLAQLDHYLDPQTGGLVPSLHPGVTQIDRRPDAASAEGFAGRYARSGNSNAELVERILGQLEHGATAAVFCAGSAAAQAVFATLRPGDRVVIDSGAYYEFVAMLSAFGARWGVTVICVDLCDLVAAGRAIAQPGTCLVWAECATNPLWRVPDIAALAALAHGCGARLLVDATVATPCLCRPLTLGADIVLHSATKYLNGHGDLVAGVLVAAAADDHWRAMLAARETQGTVLPPFEAWLLLRGMRSLSLRMDRVSQTALLIAEALRDHQAVTVVHYPGLPDSPYHTQARRQFQGGFGGMLSFEVCGTTWDAIAVCARAKLFRCSTSLGSPESLIEHRRSTEGPNSACPDRLIRLSTGLEDPQDLIDDLLQALPR